MKSLLSKNVISRISPKKIKKKSLDLAGACKFIIAFNNMLIITISTPEGPRGAYAVGSYLFLVTSTKGA